MFRKTTHVFANHGVPLECDIYDRQSSASKDKPVFLFFHAGGLVGCGRDRIPAWLVQVCLQRDWSLISASYRLLPQPGGAGLLEDASAAYEFARNWEARDGKKRNVIVGGASAGFFPTCLVAHHCSPSPLVLLSIAGINTFRHNFYNSSHLLSPAPIQYSDVAEFFSGPAVVGVSDPRTVDVFTPDKLLPDGARNPAWKTTFTPITTDAADRKLERGDLFEYLTHKNGWRDLIGDVDLGYAWAKDDAGRAGRDKWPQTVILHGDADVPVPLDISLQMQDCLGRDKVQVFVAPGQEHLFEQHNWIEDEGSNMDLVREAVSALDKAVDNALKAVDNS